jgi:hypothetical protein
MEEWSTQIPKFTSIEDGYQNFELPQKEQLKLKALGLTL